jgi:hypothetical protein
VFYKALSRLSVGGWRAACAVFAGMPRVRITALRFTETARARITVKFTGSSARQGIFRICGHCRLRARSLNLRLGEGVAEEAKFRKTNLKNGLFFFVPNP